MSNNNKKASITVDVNASKKGGDLGSLKNT